MSHLITDSDTDVCQAARKVGSMHGRAQLTSRGGFRLPQDGRGFDSPALYVPCTFSQPHIDCIVLSLSLTAHPSQANEEFKRLPVRMSCGALEGSSAEVKAAEAADAARADAERSLAWEPEQLDK